MLFVSTFVLEPALVFAKLLLVKYRGTASAFAVSPIAKKNWILAAFSRICHRLNVCLLPRLGCLTLILENDSCLSQSSVQPECAEPPVLSPQMAKVPLQRLPRI